MYVTTISVKYTIFLGKASGWIIDLDIEHSINISRCNPLSDSSYIKLLKELGHTRKGLINIHNTNDNKCLKWRIVRCLHPSYHHPARIRKFGEILADELDAQDLSFQSKLRTLTKFGK